MPDATLCPCRTRLSVRAGRGLAYGTTDDKLTPLGNMLIDGIKIKTEGDDAVCGVFYKNLVSGVKTKIAKRDLIENHATRLLRHH